MKPVRLSRHAADQISHRGASVDEVVDAIQTADWTVAEFGRFDCRKDFDFGDEWNGSHYDTKQVRPIFVDEPDEIVVVTVYVYYF